MITSVTSATVTATSAASELSIILGAGGALALIGMLIILELVGDAATGWQHTLRRAVWVSTAPLLFVFAVSIAIKVLAIATA